MLINNINLNKNFAKTNFKNNEKNDINYLKQVVINDRIYEIRQNTKLYNNQLSNVSLVSSLAIIRISNNKKFKSILPLPLLITLGLLDFARPLDYGYKYKEEMIEKPLKKKPFGLGPILSTIGAASMLIVNLFDNKIKTVDDKFKNFGLAALLIGIGCIHDYITNTNVKMCEDEVNKLKTNSKVA